jgi:hypothetical protein
MVEEEEEEEEVVEEVVGAAAVGAVGAVLVHLSHHRILIPHKSPSRT